MVDRYDEYVIVHVGKKVGGFGKRFSLFVDVLRKRRPACVKGPVSALWHLTILHVRGRRGCVIVYYDVLAPFVAVVRWLFPRLTVVYMVRGDQVSWATFQGRRRRARMAGVFQKWMYKLGCVLVFASEDLRDAFTERLGPLPRAYVLPNTVGHALPPSRPFDGRIATIGDFGTVKNIESVLTSVNTGEYRVDLFGNTRLPKEWERPWLHSHGIVADLPSWLQRSSLVVLASLSEGFPNVAVEALEAGCCVVAPEGPPFRGLPLSAPWRYQRNPHRESGDTASAEDLARVLHRLRTEPRDFRTDNRELYDLIESDWETRVWEIFG